jgi:hypothetical protein
VVGLTLPASGMENISLFLPPGLVMPGEALPVYAQGLFGSPTQGVFIGSPFVWLILDQMHDALDGCTPGG